MNTKTALLALIVAIAAAAGAWFVLRPAPAPPPPAATWLKGLDVQRVASLSAKWSGGETATIERCDVPGVWLLRPQTGGKAEPAWPVAINQVRGVIRLLSEIDALPAADGQAPASGTSVTIRMKDGAEHTLTLSETALGGKVLVDVRGTPDTLRLADARLLSIFQDGLRAWRQPGVLIAEAGDAENPGEVSRVRLQTQGRQLTLGQTLGRWNLQQPLVAPAATNACNQLVQHLSALPIQRVISESISETASGLASPTAMIDTESDFRVPIGPDVARRVLKQKVTVGGPSDTTGDKLYALAQAEWQDPATGKGTTAWGPLLVVLNRSDLNTLTAAVEPYLPKTSLGVPGADVAGLTLVADDHPMDAAAAKSPKDAARSVHLVRTVDGWRYKSGEDKLRPPTDEALARIEATIKLLCDEAAEAVGTEPPAQTQPLATIWVAPISGPEQPLGFGVASVTPPGKPAQPAIVVRNGNVYRVYIGKAADVARWIAEELPPEG